MGRFLLYLSSHWVRYRISTGERKLHKRNRDYLEKIESLKLRLVTVEVDLEMSQVDKLILQKEVEGLTKVIERDRKRVAAEIRDFGLVDEKEESNVS